ncbi:hypothetical protein SDC9_90404 [bioreactor metagenome]|uniref:Uncharacterized protein n=1 Tax=bioreactor metagenome TaxID=1076179 RepID=A0A644ZSJ7_9ZZZZ
MFVEPYLNLQENRSLIKRKFQKEGGCLHFIGQILQFQIPIDHHQLFLPVVEEVVAHQSNPALVVVELHRVIARDITELFA